jgi:hypothetical protein
MVFPLSEDVLSPYAKDVARAFVAAPSPVPCHKILNHNSCVHNLLDLKIAKSSENNSNVTLTN